MATHINHDASAGVRTYRGRTLEELIPQIRAELGPEAIILREREGVVGGVGGFFSQHFVEVDARRGDGGSIDIYDDFPDADLRPQRTRHPAEIEVDAALAELTTPKPDPPRAIEPHLEPHPELRSPERSAGDPRSPERPADDPRSQQRPAGDPRSQARPFEPRVIERGSSEGPRPMIGREEPEAPPRPFETDVFLQRLREAGALLPDADDVDETPLPARRPRPAPLPDSVRKPAPRPAPRSSHAADVAPAPVPENPYSSVRPRPASPPAAERAPRPASPPRAANARPAPRAAKAPGPRAAKAAPPPRAAASAKAPRTKAGRSTLRPLHHRIAPDSMVRAAISKLGGRAGRLATAPRLALPSPAHSAAVEAVATALRDRGASDTFAAAMITAVSAHASVLSADLREATESEIARRILCAPPLPVAGAAVAFIGAGGSGKTSCTAALAGAYHRNSTLPVTVVTLDSHDGGRELKRRLGPDGIDVHALKASRAAGIVGAAREGGMVIVDSGAVTPTDADAVKALGESLGALELDALYVALPATLSPQAARRVLASFATLRPSAVAITHADETDQLGVIVEIAISHRVPLAYLHAGTDHRSALRAVNPAKLAHELFP